MGNWYFELNASNVGMRKWNDVVIQKTGYVSRKRIGNDDSRDLHHDKNQEWLFKQGGH